GLRRAGQPGHGVGFDAHARDTELLAFDERRTGATKGVEDNVIGSDPEAIKVLPDEVRWVGEHEAVPVVHGAIFGAEPVGLPGRSLARVAPDQLTSHSWEFQAGVAELPPGPTLRRRLAIIVGCVL